MDLIKCEMSLLHALCPGTGSGVHPDFYTYQGLHLVNGTYCGSASTVTDLHLLCQHLPWLGTLCRLHSLWLAEYAKTMVLSGARPQEVQALGHRECNIYYLQDDQMVARLRF